jgi:ATP-dependent helicase/nuclease subunit B
MNPRVFNIPASARFLPALARALIEGKLIPGFPGSDDPLALAQLTLYLPTRRAVKLARETFLSCIGRDAAVLPRIVAIGDIDEDELAFAQAATGEIAEAALALPQTLDPLERKLLLAQLVVTWASSRDLHGTAGTPLVANTPSAALLLAGDLARLIDDMTTRGVGWDKLDALVPERFDAFWQMSLRLLMVLRDHWPRILHERGVIEAAERRDLLIKAEAERLARGDAPVVVAGSTGSMPSTAELIATVARLPHGAVVLPGLDMTLDEQSWELLAGLDSAPLHDGGMPAFNHPQFAMQGLLGKIGIARADVQPLAAPGDRETFLSEALRPAVTTEHWPKRRKDKLFAAATSRALHDVAVIEAGNSEEEALAVAIALREADEQQKSAALITPDRALARRVVAALARWNVAVNDSAGDPLSETPAGVFARLVAEVGLGGAEPVPLLAMLKHPLFGETEHRAIAALERGILRGPRPRRGIAGLAQALATYRAGQPDLRDSDPRKFISANDLDAADALVLRLAAMFAPLERGGRRVTLSALAQSHATCIEALSAGAAFANADGKQLRATLDALIDTPAAAELSLRPADYEDFFRAATAGRIVRLRERPGVNIRILGPLEARLQDMDRVVLGGLNEGSWPPETRTDPWLSRPMRLQLGLDLPERRVGLAAHDFAQALGAREVILTRAAKVGGAPMVASRFIHRIAALAGTDHWSAMKARGAQYLGWAHSLDAPGVRPQPAPRPEPKPPLEARPRRLSVTEIEDWLRDPYTIYAKHVLRLRPLDAVDTPPGAADRGSVIHEAIGEFTRKFADSLPDDPEHELLALGETSFASLKDYPEAQAFWWPRFQRIARWLAAWERERRPKLATVRGEISGRLVIPLGGAEFILTARADRIERRHDGSYVVVDYKTGQPPTGRQVATGMSPQLTLEGAIIRGGGFAEHGIPAGPIAEVTYVRLHGGDPAGISKDIDFKDATADDHAEKARTRLAGVAARFLIEDEPYRSLVHPMWTTHYGDYDHLARVKEWAASGGESEYEIPGAAS